MDIHTYLIPEHGPGRFYGRLLTMVSVVEDIEIVGTVFNSSNHKLPLGVYVQIFKTSVEIT